MGSIFLRWLWALPIVAVIWWLGVLSERATIEADLKTRADAALESVGLGWVKTSFRGIDAYLGGLVFEDSDRDRARSLVSNVWGVWDVADGTELVARRARYRWSASLDGQRVMLDGYFPTPRVRDTILSAVGNGLPGREVQNDMEPARGAPDEEVWLAGVVYATEQLARLKTGRVTLEGQALSVEGQARNSLAYEQITRALKRGTPAGIRLAEANVTPPQIAVSSWTATLTKQQLALSGYVPSAAARESLMRRAKEAFPDHAIIDRMEIASIANASRWLDATTALIGELAQLKTGKIVLSGRRFDVSGLAEEEAVADAVRARLGQIGAHFEVDHNIRFQKHTVPTIRPFVTSFFKDKAGIKLTGYAPDQAEIDRLIALARKPGGGINVVSTLAVANGAPEGWRTCVAAGLSGLMRLDAGHVEVIARKLQLTGTTKDETLGRELPAIVRAAANRACDDIVEVKLDLPPEPELQWQATTRGTTLRLTGAVPDSQVKSVILTQAKVLFPGFEIIDEMRVQPGRSDKWPKVAVGLLEQLAKLREGEAAINGQAISLSGQARDTAVVTAVKARMKRGFATGYIGEPKLEIRSDAMIWAEREAARKAESTRLAETERRNEDEEAARRAEDERLRRLVQERRARQRDDGRRQREAAERVEAERRAADAARREADDGLLRRLRERRERLAAEARRRDELAAEARRNEEKEARERAVRAAEQQRQEAERQRKIVEEARRKAQSQPADEKTQDAESQERRNQRLVDEARERRRRLSPEARAQQDALAKRCETEFSKSIERNRIRFEFNSVELRPDSRTTLDRIARQIQDCPGILVEIAGHTDSLGPTRLNQELSERRAIAVRDYLVGTGVDADRLIAKGYGETRPRVANRGARNRALNRRIEFRAVLE